MINFPVPHPDELIYSVVARAGVNSGILSHKQLLDSVFSNRKVIATMDLPCHLEAIAAQLKGTGRFVVSELINKHTMFGLYAPFVDTEIRAKAMSLMASRSEGAVHLMLGVAASRVKTGDEFKFCPACMQNQFERYGECFWDRRWYMPSIGVCPEHGYLELLNTRFGDHRHQFLALDPVHQFNCKNEPAPVQLMEVAKAAASLLDLNVQKLPTQQQWTLFYKRIASDVGFCRGNHVCHDDIHQQLTAKFSHDLLKTLNLRISMNEESCWLRAIFRKHRTAFSYLEHILIWNTLLPCLSVPEIINQAASSKALHPAITRCSNPQEADVVAATQIHRERWNLLVAKHGVKPARNSEDGGSHYMWLYRYDRDWLMSFNAKSKKPHETVNSRVDWTKRDLKVVRLLLGIKARSDTDLKMPRLSTAWLLKQLPNKASVSKNLEKLPLTMMFMHRYSETVEEYQIRRICSLIAELKTTHRMLKSHELLREAGLSLERAKPLTLSILSDL